MVSRRNVLTRQSTVVTSSGRVSTNSHLPVVDRAGERSAAENFDRGIVGEGRDGSRRF